MRILFLIVAASVSLQAERPPERIEWCSAPQALAGRVTEVRLLPGQRISGALASITATTFTLTKDNGKSVSFARQEIRSVKASRRRVRGRVLGAIAGFYSSAAIGAAATGSGEAIQSQWGLVAIGTGVAGYFLGRSMDRDTREITLLNSPGCD